MNNLRKIRRDAWCGLGLALLASAFAMAGESWIVIWFTGATLGVSVTMCWVDVLLFDLRRSVERIEARQAAEDF